MEQNSAKKLVVDVIENNVRGLTFSPAMMGQKLTDIGVDSLDVMVVMMEIQEQSGITIGDDDAERLDTPEKIVDFISN